MIWKYLIIYNKAYVSIVLILHFHLHLVIDLGKATVLQKMFWPELHST